MIPTALGCSVLSLYWPWVSESEAFKIQYGLGPQSEYFHSPTWRCSDGEERSILKGQCGLVIWPGGLLITAQSLLFLLSFNWNTNNSAGAICRAYKQPEAIYVSGCDYSLVIICWSGPRTHIVHHLCHLFLTPHFTVSFNINQVNIYMHIYIIFELLHIVC